MSAEVTLGLYAVQPPHRGHLPPDAQEGQRREPRPITRNTEVRDLARRLGAS
ncbi:hypothetical protein ACPCSG_04340 [Streptomyces cellulosae]